MLPLAPRDAVIIVVDIIVVLERVNCRTRWTPFVSVRLHRSGAADATEISCFPSSIQLQPQQPEQPLEY